MPGLSSTARDVETIRVGALRLQRRDSNQQSFMDSGVLGSFSGHHDVIISFSAICHGDCCFVFIQSCVFIVVIVCGDCCFVKCVCVFLHHGYTCIVRIYNVVLFMYSVCLGTCKSSILLHLAHTINSPAICTTS